MARATARYIDSKIRRYPLSPIRAIAREGREEAGLRGSRAYAQAVKELDEEVAQG